jgi:ribonuclease BN (tRNA processing enzyme)
MRIRVLGCSGGVGPDLRTTSLLLDEEILIDAGTGVGDLSLCEMSRIHRVFLTHAHLDHVCGLAFMADNLFGEVDHPIEVVATPQTIGAIRAHLFNWQLWPDFTALPSTDAALLRMRESAIGEPHDLGGGRRIQSFEVRHTIPAVGYVLRSERGVFAFTGDTGACDSMWDVLNALPRLDKLMIDIAFPDELAELGRISRHYTPAVLAGDLRRLRHRPELLLTHHKPGCESSLHDECSAALAGWRYSHLQRGTVIEL